MRNLNENLYFWDVLKKTPANMVKCTLPSILALSLGFGLLACGDTKTAGGGPSGTEAGNAITAEIITADKSPAALARVRLMDSEGLDSEKAYSAETDKNGKVVIEGVADGDYTLEANLKGEALQVLVNVSGSNVDLGKDQLKKMAAVSGTVGDSANGVVKVRGMKHSAKVVDGAFTLDSLPEGALSLVFISDADNNDTSSTYLKVEAGKESKSSTFADESRALLLEDFQDSNYQNRFMPARTYDGGWWYYAYSAKNVTSDYVIGENHIFTLANEDGNICAHVGAHFGRAIEDSTGATISPWATIGIELGKSDKALCNDISSVDSIAFRIRGIGSVNFSVVDDHVASAQKKLSKTEVELGSEWERVSIPLEGEKEAYKCVNQLVWDLLGKVVDDYVEVWLDDIELIGGDRLSIWEK
ncbi:hypothetical protein SAMN05720487_10378 [Fibrobacter sp. UWT2]|uniref:carboxypeptidase-like regulatory domain-containing protein n=1 Tax=Fibrobacter sp. UWT2 TaxID=1896224 RepID=UPI000915D9E3|nr:carboxypeptidase-like regulatory domain-containing protein [Fibrobacter sp. UWT2]SHK61803.1 hypothetical protein SAMN05720487_10378 [Fibrobacter sp. UWT2]